MALGEIKIVNKKHLAIYSKLNHMNVYIGRPSILGNKHPMNDEVTREIAVERNMVDLEEAITEGVSGKYNEIFEKLKSLAKLVKEGKNILLICWCKPLVNDDIQCHGDNIKAKIYWMIENGVV